MVSQTEQSNLCKSASQRLSTSFVRNLAQALDTTVIFVTGFVPYYIYVIWIHGAQFTSQYFASLLLGVIVACVLFHFYGVYDQKHLHSKPFVAKRMLYGWAISFAVLLFVAFALKITDFYSRVWAIAWFCSASVLLLFTRMLLIRWIHHRAKEGALGERCVVFGAGEPGQRFAAQICDLQDPFIDIVGFIDDRTTRVPQSSNGLMVLGNSETLLNMIRANLVDQVFVALPWTARNRLKEVIKQLQLTPVRVSLVSDPLGFDIPVRSIKYINNAPTLEVVDQPLSGWSNFIKWAEDRVLSALILIFVSPLLALIAIAIKFDSPGPIFFKQKRYGFNNQEIEVWKFRSMHEDNAVRSAPMRQATRNDHRVTRVGRFLRRSSLDELPQFINVFLGDMSIVGPRPHAIAHMYQGQRFEEIIDRYAARHRVKPGITGWAQINGWRGETDTVEKLEKRLEFDLYYIENWSLLFDIWIIMKTIAVVMHDRNAY